MNHVDVISLPSDAELAQAAARAWLELVSAASHAGRTFGVALSGGRITLKFFSAVIEQARHQGCSLDGVEFFWADERCVPPDDAESNFAAADKRFFQPLAIAPARIHRIRGEETPEFAAQQAEAELCRVASLNADGQPMLDLVFLGMGEDGHVASLFPGESESARTNPAVYRAIRNSPKPPPTRVTLGYPAIAAAREVWVLASGGGKEAALRESLKPDGQTPLSRVLQTHPKPKVFTDIHQR